MTAAQRKLVTSVLRDARRFNQNRALFHQAHAASAVRPALGPAPGCDQLVDALEYHSEQCRWHREVEQELTEVLAELEEEHEP